MGSHTKSREYKLHIWKGTPVKEGIDNHSLITGFSISILRVT
ncbi:conserved hypothetical protein [Microcystis sp. T1-4]|nr:conserved hypothetical protein [Microcystis sp. T1-4]